MRTQVGIVGAGPAGLLLSHLLHLRGIDSVVLEARDEAYCRRRIRAGVLEQSTVDLLRATGLGERMDRQGLVHGGVELRFDGVSHRVDLSGLTGGRAITVYGQHEVVADLLDARKADGADLRFEVSDVTLHDLEGDEPRLRWRDADGTEQELTCDVIAGCDGFHGVSRPSIPADRLTVYEREYPFAWLGILAAVAPSNDELIYASTERGFALHSLRSPEVTRLYLQVDPDADLADWPDDRVWAELQTRLASPGWTLKEGPVTEKGVAAMRSFVAEPMRHGRLFLAGDAAHIVPATGAKGLNLAVNDVRVLAAALDDFYRDGDERGLDTYSATCLRRVWRVQHFSWWMTSMLHRFPGDDPFERRLRRSQLEYVVSSKAAATTLAENYVGLTEA